LGEESESRQKSESREESESGEESESRQKSESRKESESGEESESRQKSELREESESGEESESRQKSESRKEPESGEESESREASDIRGVRAEQDYEHGRHSTAQIEDESRGMRKSLSFPEFCSKMCRNENTVRQRSGYAENLENTVFLRSFKGHLKKVRIYFFKIPGIST
jgi:hypothetical protein